MLSFVVPGRRRPHVAPLLALLLAGLPLGLSHAASAHAASPGKGSPRASTGVTIVVTTNGDDDGSVAVGGQGQVPTLRDALNDAQSGNTIDLTQVNGTIFLTNGALTIGAQNLTINGPGAGALAVDGGTASSVFVVNSGVSATISGLTVQNGSAVDGGGIDNAGTLTLSGCTIGGGPNSGNSANYGGGIFSTGALTLSGCLVDDNAANYGGGIFSTGALSITTSTVSNNLAEADAKGVTASGGTPSDGGGGGGGAGAGGGLYSDGATTITASTFSGNSATGGTGQDGGYGGQDGTAPGAGGTGGGIGLDDLLGGTSGTGAAGTASGVTTSTGSLSGETGGAGGAGDIYAGGGGGGGGGLTTAATQTSQVTSGGRSYTVTTVLPGNGQGGAGGAGGFGAGGGGGGGVYTTGVIGGGGSTGIFPGGTTAFGGGAGGSGVASQINSQQVNFTTPIYYDTSYFGDGGGGGGGGAGLGGGIYSDKTISLTNVTLADNTAQGGNGGAGGASSNGGYGGAGYGGGLFNNGGTVTSVNSTLAFNTVIGGSGAGSTTGTATGGALYTLGESASNPSGISLTNTILADTNPTLIDTPNGARDFSQSGPGVTDSGSNNLIQNNDVGGAGFSAGGTTGGYITGDPRLDPNGLQDNGGLTATIALTPNTPAQGTQPAVAGSPALAAGTATGAPPTDQRGVLRPQGVRPDIGAYQSAFIAVNHAYSVYSTGTNNVTAANGLIAGDTDPYGGTQTAVLVTPPAHGTLTLNPNGSFTYTYTPNSAGFVGTDGFTYQVRDSTGALSSVANVSLTIQNTSVPTTTATLNPPTPNGRSGWYTVPVQVTLTPTDANGAAFIASTTYTLDGGSPQTYTPGTAIVVSGNLIHTLTFSSVDQGGNKELPHSLTIKIDGTAPVTTATTGAGGQVTLTATDNPNGSGVAATFYTLDGGTRQTYTAGSPITTSGVGSHTLTFYSVDVAGNTETPHTQTTQATGQLLHTFAAGLQMIAVPEDDSAVPLASAWDAPAGQTLYDYTAGAYVTTTALPTPGQGAWVSLTAGVHLYDAGAVVPTSGPFAITLTARNWNLIGNPFLSAVAESGLLVQDSQGHQYTLSQANQKGLVYSTLLTWPAGATAYQYQSPSGSLNAYQGYFIYAFQGVTLLVPVPSGQTIPPLPPLGISHGTGRH